MFEKHIFRLRMTLLLSTEDFATLLIQWKVLVWMSHYLHFYMVVNNLQHRKPMNQDEWLRYGGCLEAVNARIKQFKFLANTIQNSSIPYLEQYVSIACAIINKYRPPIKTSTAEDIQIAEKMNSLRKEKKKFETVTSSIVSQH